MKLSNFMVASVTVASAFGSSPRVAYDTHIPWVKVKTFYYPVGSLPPPDIEGDRIDRGCCHNFDGEFQAIDFHPNFLLFRPDQPPYEHCNLVMYSDFDCRGETFGLVDFKLEDFNKRIDFSFWALSAGLTCDHTLHRFERNMEMWRRRRAHFEDYVGDDSGHDVEEKHEPYICPGHLPWVSDKDTSLNNTDYGIDGDTERDMGDPV